MVGADSVFKYSRLIGGSQTSFTKTVSSEKYELIMSIKSQETNRKSNKYKKCYFCTCSCMLRTGAWQGFYLKSSGVKTEQLKYRGKNQMGLNIALEEKILKIDQDKQ